MGCATAQPATGLPARALHAPAEVVAPFVPAGEAVDPATATSLDLEALLVYADANAPIIRTAQARVGLGDAAMVEAAISLPDNPEVSLAGGGRTVGGETGFEFEVAVAQRFEIGGEPELRREAAAAGRETRRAAVNEVRWLVHVEVHRLYVGVLLASAQRQQAERFITLSEKLREVASQQVEAGESSPLILLVADADLAQTREALIDVTRLERALATRLGALIGWPAGASLPKIEGALPELARAPETPALLERMAQNHPTLRTRELAVEARRAEFALQAREGWFEPTVGLSYGREAAPGGGEAANIWLIAVGVPLPIWRSAQGAQARAEAETHIAAAARDEAAAALRGQLEEAALNLNAAYDRVKVYEDSVIPQIEQKLALLQRAYTLGEVDLHQVSQTRERLLDVTARYLKARVSYFETAATLEGLVGTELWPKDTEATP